APVAIAGDLRELARCGRLDQLPGEASREAHALAVDVRSRVAQELEGVRRIAKIDADLLEDRVGILLDQGEPLLREDFERRQRAGEERDAFDDRVQPGGPSSSPTS